MDSAKVKPKRSNPLYNNLNFPEPDIDPEKRKAFRIFLIQLFEQYPPDDMAVPESVAYSAKYCRRKSLEFTDSFPAQAAHWACETGAPDDEIAAAYRLLFG